MEAYREVKAKIFAHQRAEDAIVLNADDPEAYALRQRPHSRVYLFSRLGEVERGAFVREGLIILRDGAEETVLCPTAQVAIPGSHNLENALAAALLAWLGGVPVLVIAEALAAFPGVEHRLEYVRTVDGVVYINDSKGTNVDASLKALAAFPQQKVLIAGGYEKGADFAPLARALVGEVSHVVLLGQVAERLAAAPCGRQAMKTIVLLTAWRKLYRWHKQRQRQVKWFYCRPPALPGICFGIMRSVEICLKRQFGS